jgi:hypothetical protein
MSVTTMLRAVKKQDEWRTPAYAVEPLIQYLWPKSAILCPFDTPESAFVKVLRKAGHRVAASHISTGRDFFSYQPEDMVYDYVISNPPYSIKDAVFEHLIRLGVPFAMLTGAVAGLFEGKRFDLFEANDVELLWLKPRVAFIDQRGAVMKSPPFQSCYVCRKVLPDRIMFARLRKGGKCT